MVNPFVDAVIVTYNSTATVRASVDSLLGCDLVAGVALVDNASAESLPIFDDDRVTVLRNSENVGFARAVNAGARRGASPYVLLLNPDAEVSAESLGRLVDALETDETAAMAGPLLVGASGRLTLGARRFSKAWNRTVTFWPLLNRDWLHLSAEYKDPEAMMASGRSLPVDYLWGACLLVRRSFLESVGGLDERYFLYSEDEDLGREARRRGYRTLLVTSARAAHVGSVSSGGRTPLVDARQTYASSQLLEKWEGAYKARLYELGARAGLCVNLALARVRGRQSRADHFREVVRLLADMSRRGSAAS